MSLKKKIGIVASTFVLGGVAWIPSAFAATGNTVNGCTANYYSTAFSTNCSNTSVAGYYATYGYCNNQGDFWAPKSYVSKGATVTGISRGECRYGVQGAKVAQVG
jgi:hypothetical protein